MYLNFPSPEIVTIGKFLKILSSIMQKIYNQSQIKDVHI